MMVRGNGRNARASAHGHAGRRAGASSWCATCPTTWRVMAQTAIEQCRKMGFKIGVSVVRSRRPCAGDVARSRRRASYRELAQRKAYTSRIFRQTTRAFSQRLIDNPISAGLGTTSGVVASLGGLPIMVGDETIAVSE